MASIEIDGANQKIKLDSDGDTFVEAATDDTIKVNVAGAEDLRITANAINVLSGTTLTIDSGATIANSGTATGFASAADDISTGDAAVTIATSTGNITIDAQGDDTDIIFKGTDGGADTTFLTIDGSAAGAATFNGVVTADAGVNIDNITIDGTTASLSGSSDFTIDVGGRIDLSADDNGEIRLYDGSSMYGQFKDDSDRFKIQAMIQDKDIMFVGNDGGSEVTSLVLDMSENGNAAFNATVYFGGSSNTANSITQRTNVAGSGYAMLGGGLWYVDDRDPKPADFPVGLMANFASYDGNSGGSPYADVIILDLFGHSSAGNANAVFFKKSEVAAQIMQQTTRSTSQFSAGTIRTIDTTSASDENVKEDVVNLTDCLDKVSQLRPVSYKWTDGYINSGLSKNEKENEYEENVLATLYTDDDELPEGKKVGDVKTEGTPLVRKSNAKTTNVGLIAQEVEAVIPTVVHKNRVSLNGEEDYLKNIDYDKLVPHLIGAIKELKAKVEALEG